MLWQTQRITHGGENQGTQALLASGRSLPVWLETLTPREKETEGLRVRVGAVLGNGYYFLITSDSSSWAMDQILCQHDVKTVRTRDLQLHALARCLENKPAQKKVRVYRIEWKADTKESYIYHR